MAAASPIIRATVSAEDTLRLGALLGRSLFGGAVVGLVGPLGAGKTQLVKGIAQGNALTDVRMVTSPTFTLINEYPGTLNLYHLDAYRLKGANELLALGFDELIAPDAAVVVEWADRVESVLPADSLWIDLAPTGETRRRMSFRAGGLVARKCLDAFVAVEADSAANDAP